MKKLILLVLTCLLLVEAGIAQHNHTTAKMKLLSPYFLFKTTTAPQNILSNNKTTGNFSAGNERKAGFTIKTKINLKEFTSEQTLLEVPDIIAVKLKQADPVIRDKQNYPASAMHDGSVPVLEANIILAAPVDKLFRRDITIGFPLACLKTPWGEHELVLNFSGVQWTMYIDSELMDNDFAIGYPPFGEQNAWQINPGYIREASISFPANIVERDHSKENYLKPDVQYWMPQGHNAWVGDVATLYHEGRYHVFYLFDRRHHASKLGVGGHYFEHFSTTDFKTWTEHEAAVPIEEQWETIGTGTPFVFSNKLCIAYGLHTSRIYPQELTMTTPQKDYYKKHGKTGAFPFDLSKGYPSGASYSVSRNGVDDFKKSNILFHYSENPSVYTDPQGKLKMIANFGAKGIWASESPDSNWHNTNPDFPPGGDCTFYFRWGQFDYIIGGFIDLWSKPIEAGEDGWKDMVKEGRDFYNGINVPAVTKINDGRYLMAGWFPIRNGWGGPFVVHEMIQQPDGRIRTKWMKELIPDTKDTLILAKRTDKTLSFPLKEKSFILSFDVHPVKKKTGRLAVSFAPSAKDEPGKTCTFQLNTKELTAQYSSAVRDAFAAPEQSIQQGGSPSSVGNYAVEHLTGTDKPFTVRILVKSNSKLGGSIIDSEIAGQNTMISYRQDLIVENITFKPEETEIRNIKIMSVKE